MSFISQTLVFKSITPTSVTIQHSTPLVHADLLYQELRLDATHGLPPLNKTIVLLEVGFGFIHSKVKL